MDLVDGNEHRGDENSEVKDTEENPSQTVTRRRERKNENARKSKNPGQNRRKSRSRSRSRSRQPSNGSSRKSWTSTNAWLNFMQDFRESLRGHPAFKKANVFRLAGQQWSEMSAAEKKPYIDAANEIKRMKQQGNDTVRRNKSKTRVKKSNVAPKRKNQKKNKPDEEKREKSESESDSDAEGSAKTMESDNVSIDTDGST